MIKDLDNLTVNLDMEALTIGEIIDIEEITGEPLGAMGGGKTMSAKALMAAVFVSLRRTEPDVTLDDVRALDVSVLEPVGKPKAAKARRSVSSGSTSKPG